MKNTKYPYLDRPYPRVKLHPATIKHMKKGHPWVTKDSYTAEFPGNRTFLIGMGYEKEFALLIQDPNHPHVKARLWSLIPPFVDGVKNFPKELYDRLQSAVRSRISQGIDKERDNYYLVFGEGDRIPGLFIQKLGNKILIQHYADYWRKLGTLLNHTLAAILKDYYPDERFTAYVETRNNEMENTIRRITMPGVRNDTASPNEVILSEFGVKYIVRFDQNYDHGLYTDMSAIRKRMTKYMKGSVLNLFSYTGAYSLYSMKSGAESVVSVDLSPKYLSWLEENLDLNPDLNRESHQSLEMPVSEALSKLAAEKKQFDFIICDPPTASSDGKKTTNALDNYDKMIPQMMKVMSQDGVMVVFQNTHKVTKKKFEEKITAIAKSKGLKVIENLKMAEDCKPLSQFPEGNYLNGLVLSK